MGNHNHHHTGSPPRANLLIAGIQVQVKTLRTFREQSLASRKGPQLSASENEEAHDTDLKKQMDRVITVGDVLVQRFPDADAGDDDDAEAATTDLEKPGA